MAQSLPIISTFAALALGACVIAATPEPVPTGEQDFTDFCASCHGISGKGSGEVAATLSKRPADLTRLARRNGGTFPTTQVMAKIWGYTGGKADGVMPNFGPLLDSETVPYDGGDGIMTPTPIRLVQIAEHLQRLQVK
ncbi:MAG: cytochrome c [Pseudotabrizicola sp.]|uniref:c-type cytochrome n=1 Tax=Pseudotabrizicola sp. TaxID=2939647 RepID=UPI0027218C84|nr:cytochrome c [Pseudotabrizicola sp.]MDO8884219.1 cytochrome c [Pseudotabrizicola sp.]MDP2080550.1 cytochrome c [Pseudotabrizicola sp.]MDZ7573278.1 cytochrome c [Pseudotabrizicola sp.]